MRDATLEAFAMAKGEAKIEGDIKVATGVEGSLSLAFCGAAETSLESGVDLITLGQQIRSTLSGLGMDGSQLQTLANLATRPASSDYSGALANVRAALPVPPALGGALDNPVGFLANSPTILNFGIDNRCNADMFRGLPTLMTVQSTMCGIYDDIPRVEDYIGILNGLNVFPAAVNDLNGRVGMVCNTINNMLPRTISIPARSVYLGTLLGTVQTFPGFGPYSLFGQSTISC